MTTIDAYISDAAGCGIEFHNGLGGPATALMFKFIDACDDESVSGKKVKDASGAAVTLTGRQLREVLDGFDASGGWHKSSDQEALDAFVTSIDDDAPYLCSAGEF